MRVLRIAGALALAGAALAPRAVAQESVFGIRGLGFPGRPVSGRSAGTGGAFIMFDPAGVQNPASLGRWRTMVGWMVGVPTRRSFEGTAGTTSLGSTRFPLFGFGTIPGRRLVFGITVSEYLNRTWGVRDSVTVNQSGSPAPAIDQTTSVGGVSDLRFGLAYHLTPRIDVGVALHLQSGSTRSAIVRDFSDTAYVDFVNIAVTDYTGHGVSFGATAEVLPRLLLAGSLRLNSSLTAKATDGGRATTALPLEAGFGVVGTPARGVSLALSGSYAGWSSAADDLVAAGEERSRDTWSLGIGTEFDTFRGGSSRIPLRLGYRWRQLPFPVAGRLLSETAFSGGFALDLAAGRTTIDVAVERGSRSAGPQQETFTSGFLGVILRP